MSYRNIIVSYGMVMIVCSPCLVINLRNLKPKRVDSWGLEFLQQDVGEDTSFLRGADQTLIQSLVREVESIGVESRLVQDCCL